MPNDPSFHPLRPGILVGLSTNVNGNVNLEKEVIEAEHRTRSGAAVSVIKTKRTVHDPEEHSKANQARMKARQIISSVCAKSAFGLLCLEANEEKLDLAMAEAQRVVERFNRSARLTRVSVRVLKGRIARDDVQAIRAIKAEVAELMQTMATGIREADPKKVREAAVKARSVSAMLAPAAAEKVKSTIAAARKGATKITKALAEAADAGEAAAVELDREAIRAITAGRTAFLDLEGAVDRAEALEAPEGEARTVEFDPEADTPPEAETLPGEAPTRARTRKKTAKKPGKKAAPKKVSRHRPVREEIANA